MSSIIQASDIRKGTILNIDGVLYRVTTTQYHNPGRGAASMRAQVMDIRTGQTQFKVFSAEDTLNNLYVENHDVKFLYRDGDLLNFMHNETFEQYEVNTALFGDDVLYLKEDMDLQLVMVDDNKVIDYVLPTTITCKVAEAEVAVAGNTAGAVLKRIKTDTGLSLQVPNFVNQGDMIKVDTRDGSYVSRV